MAKIKTVLVSQPKPKLVNSPYFELQKKRKLKIDFVPFIQVKEATLKEIRLQKLDLSGIPTLSEIHPDRLAGNSARPY